MDRILSDEDTPYNHNVYPGGVPGRFQPHLVVFVDHPAFDVEQLEDTLRRRVRRHASPETRTLSIRFVSLTKRSMFAKMGTQAIPADDRPVAMVGCDLRPHHHLPNDEPFLAKPEFLKRSSL